MAATKLLASIPGYKYHLLADMLRKIRARANMQHLTRGLLNAGTNRIHGGALLLAT